MAQDYSNSDKPTDLSAYTDWLVREHNVGALSRHKRHYEFVALKVLTDFETSDFWEKLNKQLPDVRSEYRAANDDPLFVVDENGTPELLRKTFQSFFLKTYRRNVLDNRSWPNAPDGGWLLPASWFEKVSDIVRTLFVVKYLDGVEFLATKIQTLSKDCGLACEVEFQAREEGYYAAHISIIQDFDIPTMVFDTFRASIPIEIQITTQLQEVIRGLLHKHYEERRINTQSFDIKWQWDYKCAEFSTNYLGHILHYVEGMIMGIREGGDDFTKVG